MIAGGGFLFMAKDPAFLFYPGDFNTGTQFFTDEQVGKYMRLLMAQHQHGHLSENQMIFICKSYDKDVFSKFTKDKDGFWYNERLEIEVNKRKNFVLSRSKNKEGKRKNKIISKSYVKHMENENENRDVIDNIIDVGIKKENSKYIIINPKYAGEKKYRLWGVDGVSQFLEMNGSRWPRTDYCDKFLREKDGQPFDDYGHILKSYNVFIDKEFAK